MPFSRSNAASLEPPSARACAVRDARTASTSARCRSTSSRQSSCRPISAASRPGNARPSPVTSRASTTAGIVVILRAALEDRAMAAQDEAVDWAGGLDALVDQLAPRFRRVEPRRRVWAYLRGLLAPVERKNGWQLAENAGDRTPDGVQDFLARMRWDADQVRDDLQAYVVAQLGDADGVLVLDETGFVKKGTKSVGVQRQYSGTAGRIENCQIGVFLGYASRHGHALIYRVLYLPEVWANDPVRRHVAAVPAETTFATKPQLGRQMLTRAFAAGVPCRWVTGDSVYGADYALRRCIERWP